MTSAAHDIITLSDEPNWRTPDWLQRALRREFDIGLDAAADATAPVAPLWLGPDSPFGIENALDMPSWESLITPQQAVFCNPPYSRKLNMPIEPWVERLAQTGRAVTAIGILPYAPQTKHWRQFVVGFEHRATEIRLFPFRVKFDAPPGYVNKAKDGKTHGANVNTAVVIWRPSGEYPLALPWAPLQRYWVPAEHPIGKRYHTATELEGGDDE